VARQLVLAVAALVALGACSGGKEPAPQRSSTSAGTTVPASTVPASTVPASTVPAGTGTTSTGGTGIDCAAVEQARRELVDVSNAELERLGIDRSDPRAFRVQALVTGQQSAQYWTAVRDALPEAGPELAGLRVAAETVVAHWQPLDARLDAIEIADGSEAAVKEATDRYLEITATSPDEDVLPAQERLTAGVDSACAGANL
jgi:uncharacterized lipoprotein